MRRVPFPAAGAEDTSDHQRSDEPPRPIVWAVQPQGLGDTRNAAEALTRN